MNTCLHCGETFAREFDPALGSIINIHRLDAYIGNFRNNASFTVNQDGQIVWYVIYGGTCPKCNKPTIILKTYKHDKLETDLFLEKDLLEEIPIHPFHNERPVSKEVPESIADDYKEATRISGISRKGSATLARRCLQATLRHSYPDMGKKPNLKQEIDWVTKNTDLDDIIKDALHSLRDAGNFGAHPAADGLTEIYELEQEDLEACFILLDNLFKILYVRPALEKSALAKLKEKINSNKNSSQ